MKKPPAISATEEKGRQLLWILKEIGDMQDADADLAPPVPGYDEAASIAAAVRLVKEGADLTLRKEDGDKGTALMEALMTNSGPVIDAIIATGRSLDEQDKTGRTALMLALTIRAYKDALKLLDGGADFTIRNGRQNTALHLAVANVSVWGDDPFIIRTLIERGSDMEAVNVNDKTPEMMFKDESPVAWEIRALFRDQEKLRQDYRDKILVQDLKTAKDTPVLQKLTLQAKGRAP